MDVTELIGEKVAIATVTHVVGDPVDTSGREGVIYEVKKADRGAGSDEGLIKVFREEMRDEKIDKVKRMIENEPPDPSKTAHAPSFAWPQNIVGHDGDVVGYSMPYVRDGQIAEDYARKRLRWDQSEPKDRYKPAVNLTLTLGLLHDRGYAVGDLSDKNVLITDGRVSLVDVDSYSVKGSNQYAVGGMQTPQYTPPEGLGDTYEEVLRTDEFAAAVHIFQFLMEGTHPFQAAGAGAVNEPASMIEENPFVYPDHVSGSLHSPSFTPDYAQLEVPVRGLFERCFVTGKSDPEKRPTLAEWRWALNEAGYGEIPSGIMTKPEYDWHPPDRQSPTPGGSSSTGTTGANRSSPARASGTSSSENPDATTVIDVLQLTNSGSTSTGIDLERVAQVVVYALAVAIFLVVLAFLFG